MLGAGGERRKQVLSPKERKEELLAQLPVDTQDIEKRGCCYAKVRLEWDSQGNVMTLTLANHRNHLSDLKIQIFGSASGLLNQNLEGERICFWKCFTGDTVNQPNLENTILQDSVLPCSFSSTAYIPVACPSVSRFGERRLQDGNNLGDNSLMHSVHTEFVTSAALPAQPSPLANWLP